MAISTSDIVILAVAVLGLCLIFVGVFYLSASKGDASAETNKSLSTEKKAKDKANKKKNNNEEVDQPPVAAPHRRRRAANRDPVVQQQEIIDPQNDDINEDDVAENNEVDPLEEDANIPVSKKEWLKMEKKRAKAEARASEEARRDAKKEKEAKRAAAQLEKELEKAEEEKKREEEAALLKEELEKKNQEEYDRWKDMISVEATGSEDIESNNRKNLLDDFINFIKRRKVILYTLIMILVVNCVFILYLYEGRCSRRFR